MEFRLPLSAAVVAVALLPLAAAPDSGEAVAKLSVDWVKTRAETVRVDTDWIGQRELLESTVKALEDRARQLEEKRDLLKAKTAKEQGELEALEQQNRLLAEQLGRLEAQVRQLDERLMRLQPKLPPRLALALVLPLKSLGDPTLSPGDRMAHTMTVLNRCAQFNRSVSFGEEIVTAPGASAPKLMQTVYWGLNQGYAYDKAAHQAWRGEPGSAGWTWTPCEETERVRALMASFDEKAEPAFLPVPARAGGSQSTGKGS